MYLKCQYNDLSTLRFQTLQPWLNGDEQVSKVKLIFALLTEPTRVEKEDGAFEIEVSETESEEDISYLPYLLRKPDKDPYSSYSDCDESGFINNSDSDEWVDIEEAEALSKITRENIRALGVSFVGREAAKVFSPQANKEIEDTFAKVEALLQKSEARNAFKD